MARREVRDCDRCGAKEPECVQSITAIHPRLKGAMDSSFSEWDLCPPCLAKMVKVHFERGTEDECRAFIGGSKYESYLASSGAEEERVARQDRARQ